MDNKHEVERKMGMRHSPRMRHKKSKKENRKKNLRTNMHIRRFQERMEAI